MFKYLVSAIIISCLVFDSSAQIKTKPFGKGIQYTAKDSSFYMKMNFRIQNLMAHNWQLNDGSLANHSYNMLVRRSRLKMDGWAVNPKFKYKFEMGLSNRDIGNGDGPEFNNSTRLILDAWLSWNFYKNFTLRFGQSKLPGNRERVISSANLQFVDRSRLNSRFNMDRDFGFQLHHHFYIGEQFLVREVVSVSQGEGRNITIGASDGSDYTFRLEFLPFGKFQSKGDYIGSAIKREPRPKLSVGISYDINNNALRERGQNGSFISDDAGNYYGKTLNTTFIDLMFKYQSWSIMAEYADKNTDDGNPFVFSEEDARVGTYYIGTGLSVQAGYMFDNNWELAGRYTAINPIEGVDFDEVQYTVGLNKFIVGHKLKVQTDITLRDRVERTDEIFWRTQVEFQF